MKKCILCVVVVVAVIGCNRSSHGDSFSVSKVKTFPVNDSLRLRSFGLADELERPTRIYCYDTILALRDSQSEFFVHLVSTKQKKIIKQIIKKGQGPNELIGAWHLTSMDGKGNFYVHDVVANYLMRVNMASVLSSDSSSFLKFNFRDELGLADCSEILNDSVFVASGRFDDCRLVKFNNNGVVLDKLGGSPNIDKRRKGFDHLLSESYQGILKRKPDGSKYALACKYTDQIEIFDSNSSSLERVILGPVFIKPTYKVIKNSMAMDRGKSIEGYSTIAVTNDYIIGLFSGILLSEFSAGDNTLLLVFDWDGNPVARYLLDQKCISIDIDPERDILYALSLNPQPEIFHCTLKLP